MIMTGAIFSLQRYREPISHLAPALGIATLLALDAIALSAGSFLAPCLEICDEDRSGYSAPLIR
jgi:hypothetical protein